MSTTLAARRGHWGRVSVAELDALDTMRRDPDDVIDAAQTWGRAYLIHAIVEQGTAPADPETPYLTEHGEAWVRDIHARYIAAIDDVPELIELAREWVNSLGLFATINIHRTIETR